jgi:hypothetical protein
MATSSSGSRTSLMTASSTTTTTTVAAALPPTLGDCPLCCEAYTAADLRYPMVCKTATCSFDFCLACLEKLHKSAKEGYSMASDGSHQVKIHLVCPMCRASYNYNHNNNSSNDRQTTTTTTTTTTTIVVSRNNNNNATEIVAAVILLRQAAKLLGSGGDDDDDLLKDSDRSASELARRNEFRQVTTWPDLMDAVGVVQRYYESIDKGQGQPRLVTTRDCEAWRPHLSAERDSLRSSGSFTNNNMMEEPILQRDQTLFYALEDFLTDDEQEFITALMTSGKPELLSQAAYLIYTVMMPPPPAPSPSSNKDGRRAPPPPRRAMVGESTAAQIEHRQKVRKRFPLPPHMPRCVSLPMYDPLDSRAAPLKFAVDKQTSDVTLQVSSVRGAAAKVGLQRGDVVSEIEGETVTSYGEFVVQLQQHDHLATVLVTVNSTTAVARQLRERAVQMKQAGVKFL